MPATLVKRGKAPNFDGEDKQRGKKPAKSEKEWEKEELEEQDHPRHQDRRQDHINDAVGSTFYSPDYSERWIHPRLGFIRVSRYYHHQKLAYDVPKTVEEKSLKAEFFKGKGIVYIALDPGQAVEVKEFFDMVQVALGAKNVDNGSKPDNRRKGKAK